MATPKQPDISPLLEIALGDEVFRVRAPRSFAEREDVISVWADAKTTARSRRAFAFAIGLCVPEVARRARAAYDGDNPWAFGGTVYDFLRRGGVDLDTIQRVALGAYGACVAALAPRAPEVASRVDFTGPTGDATT